MNQQKKKIILISVIAVFAAIGLCAGGYLAAKHFGMFDAERTNEAMRESFAPNMTELTTFSNGAYNDPYTTPDLPVTEPSSPPVDNKVDFDSLRKINPDVYSWIYIPDTNVNLPVLQSTEDDNFYLDHDVYRDYSFPGAIYSQSMNKKDYSDRVTVLYGHNMANGSMFATLHNFSDSDFFDTHKYFYVYTPDRRLTYEVVSAFDYDDRHILNSYDFKKDDVFTSWLNAAQNPHSIYSNVNRDVKLDLNSKLLVLSTCLNSGDGRFLVQGVLIKDEKTK